MEKGNMDNKNKENTDTSEIPNNESNKNIERSYFEDQVQVPFILEEGEKHTGGIEETPQVSTPNKKNGTTNQTQSTNSTVSDKISGAANFLGDINTIKDELVKLPLNPAEKEYLEVYVIPLLIVLRDLSTTSLNLSSSTSKLGVSYVTTPKISKLKDTEHLVYDINDKCEDIYKILKQRINYVIKCNEK